MRNYEEFPLRDYVEFVHLGRIGTIRIESHKVADGAGGIWNGKEHHGGSEFRE